MYLLSVAFSVTAPLEGSDGSQVGGYPLIAPVVRAPTMCRWRSRNSRTTGMTANMLPAARYWVVISPLVPWRLTMPTETGAKFGHVDEDERQHELGPGGDAAQDGSGGDPWPCRWQHHGEHRTEPCAAVDAGGLVQFGRDGVQVGLEEPGLEGRGDRDVHTGRPRTPRRNRARSRRRETREMQDRPRAPEG